MDVVILLMEILLSLVADALANLYLAVFERQALHPITVVVIGLLLWLLFYLWMALNAPPPPAPGPPPGPVQNVFVQGLGSVLVIGMVIGIVFAALMIFLALQVVLG